MILNSVLKGLTGALVLLGIYFGVVSVISGWSFAVTQFSSFWYYITSLAVGFGIQIGLYSYLKRAIHRQDGSGKTLAVSGTTSTAAMLSCCAHYLVNILPIIGIVGFVALISQYQIQFFWVGLVSSLAGILYIASRIIKFSKR
jgi:Cu+-exporting ATPase